MVERRYRVHVPSNALMNGLMSLFEPMLHAQNYFEESDTDGEIVLDGWDGYDPRYWVGTVYARRFSNGKWTMGDLNMDTHEDYFRDLEWAYQSGGGYDRGPKPIHYNPHHKGFFQRMATGAVNGVYSSAHAEHSWSHRAREWGKCYAGACITAAGGCWLTGPGHPLCTAGFCTASAVGCIVYFML